ncbi:MAG: IS3 family transposase, partial [Myxococcota bacterium]
SFFSTLKRELLDGQRWTCREDVAFAVFDYVETFYNRHRRHSTLGYQSAAIEQHYNAVNAA